MNLIVRRLDINDQEAFFEGLSRFSDMELSWYTFEWKEGMSFEEHLNVLENQFQGRNLPSDRVPASMLYAFLDGKIVGRSSIRHKLNDFLLKAGGHIGYAVATPYQGQGIATEVLKQSLQYCREVLHLEQVLVTCDDDNIGSYKTIEKNNGILENRITLDGKSVATRRYWINLKNNAITFLKCSNFTELINIHNKITGKSRNADYYKRHKKFKCFEESFNSYIIKKDETIVGYFTFSVYHLEENPNKYIAEVILFDTSLVNLALQKLIQELQVTPCHEVLFFSDENNMWLKNAIEKLGEVETIHHIESQFDLCNQEIANADLIEGYKIKTFKDLKNELGDFSFEFALPIVKESFNDTPGCQEQAESLTATKLKLAWQGKHFIEDACLYILYEGSPVAIHNIVSRNEGEAEAGVTGVARQHRRKGLMRALKLRGMKWAKENGYQKFVSSNEKDNPMLTLNYELGFKKTQESYSLILKIPKR